MKVHLRQRKQTKTGKISLYLEYYKGKRTTPDGKIKYIRDYEYLDIYIIDEPKNPKERQHNKQQIELAETIKSKRITEIANGTYGFTNKSKQDANFIDFVRDLQSKKDTKSNEGSWKGYIKHLLIFADENLTFNLIDVQFCKDFKQYLEKKATKTDGKKISSGTAQSYYTKLRTSLNEAVKKKIIPNNPAKEIEIPKAVTKKREYLTLDELKALQKAECRYDVLKRAFIFSCLTGIRWSDANNLRWSQVQSNNGRYKIVFHQQKTKGLQYLDISEQARSFLGEAGEPDQKVFVGLKYSSYMNVALNRWMLEAGITKNITFHCARHTFAVVQLSLGTPIYTLSKLLGHSEIKTTQIYADIIDQEKEKAVDKIPDIRL